MNVFEHIATKKNLATNYKVMFTFFRNNENFKPICSGTFLRTHNMRVSAELMVFRNPFSKFVSFYADKIAKGNCHWLADEFRSRLRDIFGLKIDKETDWVEAHKKITPSALAESLPSLIYSEPHLYPQNYCLRWIEPKRKIRMENEMHVLENAFGDTDFSEKKNASEKHFELDEKSKSIILDVYRKDFELMYPEFL